MVAAAATRVRAALALGATLGALAGHARADGEIAVRGEYYKEKATRVVQPMLDARFDVAEDHEITTHFLVDSITSASVAAGATGKPFSEIRYELGLGFLLDTGRVRTGGSVRVSSEPDYLSVFGTARAEIDFAQKNTTLGFAAGLGHDDFDNSGAQGGLGDDLAIEGKLTTALGSASLTQVISPQVIAQVTYDLSYLDGDQENLYRTVFAQGFAEHERVPDVRWRHAAFASVRGYVPPTDTAIIAGYRFYDDDWGIIAHTPEVRIVQEIRGWFLHGRFRYHRQTAADFYEEVYDSNDPMVEPFLTDDEKLSAFETYTVGVKIETTLAHFGIKGELADVRTDFVLEHVTQHNDYGNAIVASMAVSVPFDY